MKVYSFFRRCTAELYPPHCLFCQVACGEQGLCDGCLAQLAPARPGCLRCADPVGRGQVCLRCLQSDPPWASLHAANDYDAAARLLIQRLKTARQLALARVLAEIFLNRCTPACPEALVAVAAHRRRLLERGFNPALEIARCLARRLRRPLISRGLIRRRDDPPQQGRTAASRRRGPRGAFYATRPVCGRWVALVDDVMTTGSTARAAASALLAGGARRVDVWVMARA